MTTKSRTPASNFDRAAKTFSAKPHRHRYVTRENFSRPMDATLTLTERVAEDIIKHDSWLYIFSCRFLIGRGMSSFSISLSLSFPPVLASSRRRYRFVQPESDINELPLEIPIINAAHFIGSEKPFRAGIKLELGRRLDKFARPVWKSISKWASA